MTIEGKCTTCDEKVDTGDKFITCDLCNNSVHASCENLDSKKLAKILSVKDDVVWFCGPCKAKNPLNLLKMIPNLVKNQEHLEKELEALKSKVQTIAQNNSHEVAATSVPSPKPLTDMFKEFELRRTKAMNVVMVGMKIEGEDLRTPIVEFIKKNLGIDINNTLSFIHKTKGERPLMILKFNNQQARDQVLSDSKKLFRSSDDNVRRVFLNPDLTIIQRMEFKKLREELKRRRAAGERVTIRGDSIVTLRPARD